jgi:genome maintenance exonuclease 1
VFSHNWLPKLELQRVDSPAGRKYVTPEGNIYDSVTTFLGKHGKEELEKWRNAVGEVEARRISVRAASRGTSMHNNIERFLMNEEVNIPRTDLVGRSLFKSFSTTLKQNVSNIRAMEYPLYSDTLKLAGTIDLFADWKNIPSIIDFKSSTKNKDKYEIENYFLQTTIYSYMIEERYNIKVPQLVILIGVEFSDTIQVYVENRINYRDKLITLLKG